MTDFRPRRSALYMPGTRPRALAKGREVAADVVILDLEDSAAPEEKDGARENVRAALGQGGYGRREAVVRINGLKTEWGTEDLMAAIAAGANAVLVPKIEGPEEVREVASALSAADAAERVSIWVMIESPRALLRIGEIAALAGDPEVPLRCFCLGLNDIARETRAAMVPGRWTVIPWMSMTVLAARAHGLDVLDGVYNALDDPEGFTAECRQAAELGMDGKTLIHPGQIATANEVFSPSEDEVAEARRIIAAFEEPENRGKAVIRLDGRMVERLHAEMAERTVAIAEAIAGIEKGE